MPTQRYHTFHLVISKFQESGCLFSLLIQILHDYRTGGSANADAEVGVNLHPKLFWLPNVVPLAVILYKLVLLNQVEQNQLLIKTRNFPSV